MKTKNAETIEIRKKVLSNPKIILEDIEIMKALVDTHESGIGNNVIDLRSVVMSQLEAKIQKTEAERTSQNIMILEMISFHFGLTKLLLIQALYLMNKIKIYQKLKIINIKN